MGYDADGRRLEWRWNGRGASPHRTGKNGIVADSRRSRFEARKDSGGYFDGGESRRSAAPDPSGGMEYRPKGERERKREGGDIYGETGDSLFVLPGLGQIAHQVSESGKLARASRDLGAGGRGWRKKNDERRDEITGL